MRHAKIIDQQTVVTVDNAGCIGEKDADIVKAPNELVAYYTARGAILEQWCAGGHPTHIFLSNFTCEAAWADYEKGIKRVFDEIGEKMPPLNGSTESNFESMQSGISIMMIGKKTFEAEADQCAWYVVGRPLVGEEVLEQTEHVAKLNEIYMLLKIGVIKTVWPVGSKGIAAECDRIFGGHNIKCSLPLNKSAGPSTCVIVAISKDQIEQFKDTITTTYEEISLI